MATLFSRDLGDPPPIHQPCPICRYPSTWRRQRGWERMLYVDCEACGPYAIDAKEWPKIAREDEVLAAQAELLRLRELAPPGHRALFSGTV